MCDAGQLSLRAFRIADHDRAGVVAQGCDVELASGWLLNNAVAWLTGSGGRVRADGVVRRGNQADTAACAQDCPALPSPPAVPPAPSVEPVEAWPPP